MKTVNIIKYVFSFIGVGMLFGAFLIYLQTNNFIKNALTT